MLAHKPIKTITDVIGPRASTRHAVSFIGKLLPETSCFVVRLSVSQDVLRTRPHEETGLLSVFRFPFSCANPIMMAVVVLLRGNKPSCKKRELVGRRLSTFIWEGCIRLKGERKSKPVDGIGYMEQTGYANAR